MNENLLSEDEEIKGIVITEAGYPSHGYDLIFTSHRLISYDKGLTYGGFHIGDSKIMIEHYNTLTLDEILELGKYSMKWTRYNDIKKVVLKKGLKPRLYIESPNVKGRFFYKKEYYENLKNLCNKFSLQI